MFNAIAIMMGIYMMVTLPFVIDSITRINNVDDDIVDYQFRKQYQIPPDLFHNNASTSTSTTMTVHRGLRGYVPNIDSLEDDMDDDDSNNNIMIVSNETVYVVNLYVYPYYENSTEMDDFFEIETNSASYYEQKSYLIEIDNIEHLIIYAIFKDYCVIDSDSVKSE
jgi:hypothetical protein